MPVKLDMSGLKHAKKTLHDLSQMKQLALSEYLTDKFIAANSDFQTLQEMLNASGIESIEDEITEALDQFIVTHTKGKFSGWQEMKFAAFAEYVNRKLES